METKENMLDELIKQSTLNLRHMTEERSNNKFAYVTYHDIRKIDGLKEDTVIAIKAPTDTRLEVPDPQEVMLGHSLLPCY